MSLTTVQWESLHLGLKIGLGDHACPSQDRGDSIYANKSCSLTSSDSPTKWGLHLGTQSWGKSANCHLTRGGGPRTQVSVAQSCPDFCGLVVSRTVQNLIGGQCSRTNGAHKCSVPQSIQERVLEMQIFSCLLCSGAPPGCVPRPLLCFP